MHHDDLLVCEISGKRPGGIKARPTEKFPLTYQHVIISNNSDGYETDWPIVNVPRDYAEWYKSEYKTSDNAWYAPMNRTYAIKYAKEHGYRYVAQLDDNINGVEIAYRNKNGWYRTQRHTQDEMMEDFLSYIIYVLKNTNAGMGGVLHVWMWGTAKIFSAREVCIQPLCA